MLDPGGAVDEVVNLAFQHRLEIFLHLPAGQRTGLVGANGAGKSTTIGIICSLVRKSAGQVTIFGHDIDREFSQAKRLIGVVPQEFNFNQFEPVVEIVVKEAARVTYTTIQNWSNNVFNLVTKRAKVYAEGHMEWIDGNIGSKLTMKYPAVYLLGERAHGEVLSIAYAGTGQHQDAGAKMVHAAPNTSSRIISKSISKDEGRSSYRGLVKVNRNCHDCRTNVECDALLIGEKSRTKPFPITNFGDLRYTGWGGGVPIVVDDEVVGAVGVSGLPEADDIVLARMAAVLVTGG